MSDHLRCVCCALLVTRQTAFEEVRKNGCEGVSDSQYSIPRLFLGISVSYIYMSLGDLCVNIQEI
jgi:hypothetical protein